MPKSVRLCRPIFVGINVVFAARSSKRKVRQNIVLNVVKNAIRRKLKPDMTPLRKLRSQSRPKSHVFKRAWCAARSLNLKPRSQERKVRKPVPTNAIRNCASNSTIKPALSAAKLFTLNTRPNNIARLSVDKLVSAARKLSASLVIVNSAARRLFIAPAKSRVFVRAPA